jgi:hypothetical protein
MKCWPKDETEYVPFEELITPLVKAMHHCYNLKRIHKNVDFKYDGYELSFHEAATNPQADDALSAETLKWREEEHGHEAFETILQIAFQLGVEQGRRLERKSR